MRTAPILIRRRDIVVQARRLAPVLVWVLAMQWACAVLLPYAYPAVHAPQAVASVIPAHPDEPSSPNDGAPLAKFIGSDVVALAYGMDDIPPAATPAPEPLAAGAWIDHASMRTAASGAVPALAALQGEPTFLGRLRI